MKMLPLKSLILLVLLTGFSAQASIDKFRQLTQKNNIELTDKAFNAVEEIINANNSYLKGEKKDKFIAMMKGQSPRITLVTCSDSRVQNTALDKTPENDLFIIRNIGNQLSTSEGSVTYGIRHLHTPILLIVGHSRCGAIKAAMSDYSGETSAIRKEISTLSLSIGTQCPPKKSSWIENIVNNVHKQVSYAMQTYKSKIDNGDLVVIGAVFDFANDLHNGYGKLNIININGHDITSNTKGKK